jgi:periplasmic protein TonB
VSSYSGTANPPDRAKAIAAVIAIHAALAMVILSGLNVQQARQADQVETTLNLREPPPPPQPPPPPKPAPKPQAIKKPQGAPAKRAEPSPVVAPQPRIPAPSPIPAAKVAGAGNATISGAASAGNGTGAGGAGNGPGGGGSGAFTPARKLTKIPDSEYRRFAATGIESGSVALAVRVDPDGSLSNCRILRTSGNPGADALMCQLFIEYVRFRPALDPSGRPIAQDITWVPVWSRR